ncbi:MAG: hypothetical protein ACI31M_01735 [Bacilli bacterium]
MYKEDEFYFLTDKLHHDVYRVALKNYIDDEERIIIKIFKKGNEEVVIETCNGKDIIIKDTRNNKNSDLLSYELVYLKMLERYVSSYEIKNMFYEYVEGLGAWCRVKIDGFDPNDKDLDIFYNKSKVTKDIILNSDESLETKEKQLKFLSVVKDFKFTNPNKIKEKLQI